MLSLGNFLQNSDLLLERVRQGMPTGDLGYFILLLNSLQSSPYNDFKVFSSSSSAAQKGQNISPGHPVTDGKSILQKTVQTFK